MEEVMRNLKYSVDMKLGKSFGKSFDFLCHIFGHKVGLLKLQIKFLNDTGNVDGQRIHTQWLCFRCGKVLDETYQYTGIYQHTRIAQE